MLLTQQFPWLTFSLLLLAYGACGWTLAEYGFGWPIWLAVGVCVLFLVLFLTLPLQPYRTWIARRIRDEPGFIMSILTVTILSLVGVLLLIRTQVFAYTCMLVAAALLVRLDLQTHHRSDRRALLILSSGVAMGLGLGWAAHHFNWIVNQLASVD